MWNKPSSVQSVRYLPFIVQLLQKALKRSPKSRVKAATILLHKLLESVPSWITVLRCKWIFIFQLTNNQCNKADKELSTSSIVTVAKRFPGLRCIVSCSLAQTFAAPGSGLNRPTTGRIHSLSQSDSLSLSPETKHLLVNVKMSAFGTSFPNLDTRYRTDSRLQITDHWSLTTRLL